MIWFRIASHLGRTTQEVQATITSTEFEKWAWFLEWKETEEFRREDFYLAQIAAAVDRGNVKHPKKVKLKNYILKFHSKKEDPINSGQERVQRSMTFWKAMCGYGMKNVAKRALPKKVRQMKQKKE